MSYAIHNESDTKRVRFEYDEHYQTRGSYAYDTEEETKAAEDEEIEKLNSGEWVVLGMIEEEKCSKCAQWEHKDSVWGCVVESKLSPAELVETLR